MPIYEYRCTACEKEFEYQQRMADAPMTVCEACGGGLERVISRSAFHLKGGGWYKDLYASTKPEGGGGAASSPSTSTPAAAASEPSAAPASPSPSPAPSTSSDSGSSSGSSGSGGAAAS